MRPDGSWPIDTNLATWVTTLSIGALATHESVMGSGLISPGERSAMREWLLGQQTTREHPFTHAAPGGWAWTPLSGGVPDADDTSGALVALHLLGDRDGRSRQAASAGARWLLGLQNRDGGIPTFCRGWGALPFDRSTPEITAHALRAWAAWYRAFEPSLQRSVRRAAGRAVRYLEDVQRRDGSWVPLWFGHEAAPDEENPVYGTARVVSGLSMDSPEEWPIRPDCLRRAVRWLLDAQRGDGGWSAGHDAPSSIEETGVVLSALGRVRSPGDEGAVALAVARGAGWLVSATRDRPTIDAAPIGLYFARLWYSEELYPLIFALEGLASSRAGGPDSAAARGPR
jgi:squalene-hopene/tetraprenyl-beta-curcumene cyclase